MEKEEKTYGYAVICTSGEYEDVMTSILKIFMKEEDAMAFKESFEENIREEKAYKEIGEQIFSEYFEDYFYNEFPLGLEAIEDENNAEIIRRETEEENAEWCFEKYKEMNSNESDEDLEKARLALESYFSHNSYFDDNPYITIEKVEIVT